jgi:hypothetical protein
LGPLGKVLLADVGGRRGGQYTPDSTWVSARIVSEKPTEPRGQGMTDEEATGSTELSRRSFLKRMAVVGFAVPIVTSFALDGVASADKGHRHGNQTYPNQTYPNQTILNEVTEILDDILDQFLPNQNRTT